MHINFGTIQKLARLATHPSTNPNEAVVAGWKACFQILGSNPDKDNIWLNASNIKSDPQNDSLEEEIERLKAQVQDLSHSVEQLKHREKALLEEHEHEKAIFFKRISLLTRDCNDWQQESERLQALNESLTEGDDSRENVARSDTGKLYVNYELLVTKAEHIYGHKCSKSSIAFALDVPLNLLSAWQKVGIVPVEFVNKVKEFSRDQLEPASRTHWSEDEVNKLKEVLCEGLSDLEAARTLSTQFGRRRFEPNVARKRRQLAEKGWKPSPKDRSSSAWSKDDIVYPDVPNLEINQTQFPQHHAKPRHDTSGKTVP